MVVKIGENMDNIDNFKSLSEEFSESFFIAHKLSKLGPVIVESDFHTTDSDINIEAQYHKCFYEDGMLKDILQEEQSTKFISAIKKPDNTLIGVACLVSNSKVQELACYIEKPDNFIGVDNIFIFDEYRSLGLSTILMREHLNLLTNLYRTRFKITPCIAIQDHAYDYYHGLTECDMIPYDWYDLEVNQE